jgi:serine phosphatase RsbU (regulator of sigma subunit)
MIDFKDKRVQVATVVGLFAAITALRILESQTGPLYLIPVVLASFWVGRWAGLGVGLLAAVMTRVTIILSGEDTPDVTFYGEAVRGIVYGGLGYAVGALAESRVAIERTLLRRELELDELHTLQEALAPSEPPARPALQLATCYIPAEQGVSGDFHIVVPAAGGSTLIAVGDVAGRGLDAAKRAWYTRTLVLSSADVATDPSVVLERANRALVQDSNFSGPFVTVACLLLHDDGTVDWALAGHDTPIRLDTGEPLRGAGSSGLPLGVSERLRCETSTANLEPGAGLLVYTDGLTEARRDRTSAQGFELFGEQRISGMLAGLEGVPSAEVLSRVRDEVRTFSGGTLADDLCMVALRVNERTDITEVCAPDRVEALAV